MYVWTYVCTYVNISACIYLPTYLTLYLYISICSVYLYIDCIHVFTHTREFSKFNSGRYAWVTKEVTGNVTSFNCIKPDLATNFPSLRLGFMEYFHHRSRRISYFFIIKVVVCIFLSLFLFIWLPLFLFWIVFYIDVAHKGVRWRHGCMTSFTSVWILFSDFHFPFFEEEEGGNDYHIVIIISYHYCPY